MSETVGVLLATYGSPVDLDDVSRYLGHIFRRPPTEEEIRQIRHQYEAAGGTHHLPRMTSRQAALLQQELGPTFEVQIGYKHSPPFLGEAALALAARVGSGAILPLAPHYNTMSVAGYRNAVDEALARAPRAIRFPLLPPYHEHPDLVGLWAERVERAVAELPDPGRGTVIFTAHSLPSRVLEAGDPYPSQLRRTAERVGAAAGIRDWWLCYQSAPQAAPWLGPDILEELEAVAKAGATGVAVAPIGFAADHMETRFDLDVEARERARKLGLAFARAPAPNDDPRFIRCLRDVVLESVRVRGA